MEKDHTNISPSQAERFFNCPGSVKKQAEVDIVEPSTKEQMEGTAIHELAAQCLKHHQDPYDRIGDTIDVKDNFGDIIEHTVNDSYAYTAKMYIEYVMSLLEKHNLKSVALQIETKYSVDEIDKKAKGTTDCSFLADGTLYVIDLKAGQGVLVSPEENKQCMYYALRPFFDARMFIDKIVLAVIQPRAKSGEYIKEWETTPDRLLKFADELRDSIKATRKKNPPLKSGPWCRWCKAQSICTAQLDEMAEQVKDVVPVSNIPKITKLTPEMVGKALPALATVEQILKQLYSYALTLASRGEDIPNYSLTRTKKHRGWRDEQAVISEFESDLGDEIYTRKLRSPAQLEKLLKKGEKARIEDFVVVPEGDLKLVPTKEAKKAISRKAEEVFKDVEIE